MAKRQTTTLVMAPGAVSSNTEYTITARERSDQHIKRILGGYILSLTEQTPNTFTKTNLTVVEAAPANAGQIQLYTPGSIKSFTALTTSDLLVLTVELLAQGRTTLS